MTKLEAMALASIEAATDTEALLRIAANARGKSEIVERAALRRLAKVAARHAPEGTVENECWTMVYAVEALRRLKGRRVWRMNRMRPKIEEDGAIAALEYCALNKTDGFAEIIDYGTPELTAEAIVLKHETKFSQLAIDKARARLAEAGLKFDALGQLQISGGLGQERCAS